MSDHTWESRGMYDYYIDASGKIVGRTFYLLAQQVYDADLFTPGGLQRIGTYVDNENARLAVERAVEAANTVSNSLMEVQRSGQ